MRTRSASKRPPQNPPEKSEAVGSRKSAGTKRKQEDRVSAAESKDETEATKESASKEESELKHEAETNETDWEEGEIPSLETFSHDLKAITVELTDSPPSADKKPSRRASAQEKGRLVDKACNDPLIQASMLSILPSELLKITEVPNLTIDVLKPLVNWFRSKFHLAAETVKKGSFESNLQFALQNQEGTAEELAALSVILFRALDLSARFVSILDISNAETQRLDPKAVPSFNTASTSKTKIVKEENKKLKKEKSPMESTVDEFPESEGPKRKGDMEFELQLQMALSATETTQECLNLQSIPPDSSESHNPCGNFQFRPLNLRTSGGRGESAIWSRNGPSLYWAEVYCTGEMLTGRWIHVDCINGVINSENKIENDFVVCKRLLRYVVAFNGNGAKDVTRRYCIQWYKIAPKRIKQEWWERVLAPLRENGILERQNGILERDSIEDIELENRALTEPLPTNQLAYKSHNRYAIEKWLNKNQIIYPKGPVLGFVSGHPIYPRYCVQTLQTRQKWMKDGLQVKSNEIPAKKVSRTKKRINFESIETEKEIGDFEGGGENNANIDLYGKWQLEPLRLPHAVNGMVPKNEHGNVEVWSEKCVPPGTVHLRLPRLVPVAKRLEIDFAPALVGFEFRNGRTYPVFEGIVVCSEFKHALLEAYREEEERRELEEKKRDKKQALSKWFQLLSSIAVRQRLQNSYAGPSSGNNFRNENIDPSRGDFEKEATRVVLKYENEHEHEHVFPLEKQSFDADSRVRTKRCDCGFSIQVEEL